MDKFLDDIIKLIDELFYIYERYMWNNDDSNLEVLIQDNMICFYMYKNNELIDEILLSFDISERTMYVYICIRLLFILLGNVYIYNQDNLFYNDKHKKYLKLIVNDSIVLDSMNKIISMQDDVIINDNMDIVVDIRKSLIKKRYNYEFVDELNDRVNFSKKLFRRM